MVTVKALNGRDYRHTNLDFLNIISASHAAVRS